MEKNNIVRLIKQKVKKIAPDSDIILYGSQARGESNLYSDIDILILIDRNHISFAEKTKISDTLYELELKSGVIISPLIYLKKHWNNRPFKTPFYINVNNEGIYL